MPPQTKFVALSVEDGCHREYTVTDKTSALHGLWVQYRPAGAVRVREYLYSPHDSAAGWVRKSADLLAERIIDWNIENPLAKGTALPITADSIAGPVAVPGQPAPPAKYALEYATVEFLVNLVTGYVASPDAVADRKNSV